MLYYDENGEVQHTTDRDKARRYHALTVLRSGSYPIEPDAAAGLGQEVGRTDKNAAVGDLRQRIERALNAAGLRGVQFDLKLKQLFEKTVAEADVGQRPE